MTTTHFISRVVKPLVQDLSRMVKRSSCAMPPLNEQVAVLRTCTANHVLMTGLFPDTAYLYTITVIRTHLHPERAAPLCFAVLGDYGTGVRKPSHATRCQREVALSLERAVNETNIRCE